MHKRLSFSEKEKHKNNIENTWDFSTIKLLESLSQEISKEFQWNESPWIYQESIKKLLLLKEKINTQKNNELLKSEIKKLSQHLSDDKKKEFLLAIEWAKEVLKNSRDLIANIKDEINIFTPHDWKFTTQLFWQKYINRWKNPQNITDEIIWGWIWLFNSAEAITTVSVKVLIWIWKTIPDVYSLIKGTSEYDGFKNI